MSCVRLLFQAYGLNSSLTMGHGLISQVVGSFQGVVLRIVIVQSVLERCPQFMEKDIQRSSQ